LINPQQKPLIDIVREAGVRRGINASIKVLQELRDRHNKRSSGYNELTIAITKLIALTVEEAEEA
jgi:hypothetical protein